jgi:molecular chaperone DnaJ
VIYQQGFFSISRTCPICQGSGQFIKERCADCAGRGRVLREHPLELRIPAGLENNTRLRVPGEGEAGVNGGPSGDLFVMIAVKEHDFFERRGADLFCTIPISIVQASLGAQILVPTLAGDHELKIPEGTQSGTTFRLRGKGLPNPHAGGKGDMLVRIQVETPGKLSRDQKRMLQELGATLPAENRPAQRNSTFFDKVKDIFG